MLTISPDLLNVTLKKLFSIEFSDVFISELNFGSSSLLVIFFYNHHDRAVNLELLSAVHIYDTKTIHHY